MSDTPPPPAEDDEKQQDDTGAEGASQPRGAAKLAVSILADENPAPRVLEQGALFTDERQRTATNAARVLSELIAQKPDLVVALADKFAKGLTSKHKRVVQTSAEALPAIAKIAPARVARQLEVLNAAYDSTNAQGKDGLVRTFANLCIASVAYQKRLQPVLTKALSEADGKTLLRWSEIVLPALKGEPHAEARAVVEVRLYQIPRATAQKIADFLGVRLRHSYRG